MMRILFLAFFLVATHSSTYSQTPSSRGEFATNQNGLMYSDKDITALRFIVDSLNLRFKICDFSKKFYSKPQTIIKAVSFRSETNNLKDIIDDLKNNIPYPEILSRYAPFISSTDSSKHLIISEKDYFLSVTLGGGFDRIVLSDKKKFNSNRIKNKWLYTYSPKKSYSKQYSLNCYFFPEEFLSKQIPDNYANLIQYVDCMIDTNTVIFLTDKYSGGRFLKEDKNSYSDVTELSEYIDKKMNFQPKKQLPGTLSSVQIDFAHTQLNNDETFKILLANTIDNYVMNKTLNHQLETLAYKLKMYDKALLLKRCYRVIGSCSKDESPRLHARDIAILAAQAHRWDIFLRAHLDIMNDRFERMTDGSYAWGERKTYLKELEELNLNIVDLMLGLTLRAENVANNHYYGTVWRMGWALTESREKEQFEEKAITMMKDVSLDEFNRGLLFLLYKTYTYYLDNNEGKLKRDELRKNIASFPEFIRESILNLEEGNNQ